MRECRTALRGLSARLEGASYQALLERGFALVRDSSSLPVTTAASVAPGQRLTLQFVDGSVNVADERAKKRGKTSVEQETLL
jgi:exodeoxyribonuclease VII large subunit